MEDLPKFLSTISVSGSNLDKLPDTFYHDHLFKNLNIDEIMKLKLISKKFYSVVKSYKVDQLAFFEMNDDNWYENNRWFSTNEPIKLTSYSHMSNLPILIMPPANFFGLKYLKIKQTDSRAIRFKDLNKFAQLQILEIDLDVVSDDILSLPELKALSLKFSRCLNESKLVINAPMMNSLLVSELKNDIEFEHPLSVKYFQCDFYRDTALIFQNLECLEIITVGFNIPLAKDNLRKFNHLKQLKIYGVLNDEIDDLRDLFLTRKEGLEVVLSGIKIKGIDKFNDLVQRNDKFGDIKDHIENYEDLDDYLMFNHQLFYNSLEELLPSNLYPPDLFTKKYTNIQSLYSYRQVKNENRLIRIIKECPTLSSFESRNSSLSQEFYDQLPEICNLFDLLVHDEPNIRAYDLNCDFIMKMNYLQRWHTDQDVRINESLANFKYFKECVLRIDKMIIGIERLEKDKYCVSDDDDEERILNLNELIEWLDDLRKKN